MEAEGPFAELAGQDPAVAQLHAALDRPVPAYLFVGQTGWGTRRAADLSIAGIIQKPFSAAGLLAAVVASLPEN